MSLREVVRICVASFAFILSGIVLSICAFYPLMGWQNQAITFALFYRIVLMALACSLSFIIFLSGRELGNGAMRVRMVIHLAVILAIVLGLAHLWNWLPAPGLYLLLAVFVVAVYLGVMAVLYLQNRDTASKLIDAIKRHKSRQDEP